MFNFKIMAVAGVAMLTVAAPGLAQVVNNVTFANFGQTTGVPLFNYGLDTNAGVNTISLDGPIRFNVLDRGPISSTVLTGSLFAQSGNAFSLNGLQFEQTGFNGNVSFTAAGGINYLTAAFSDATFSFDGDGSAGSLISTDPSSFISYTSDVLNVSSFSSRDFAFNITGAFPGFAVSEGGLGEPFAANLSGAFAGSGGAVPEPASWAMLIMGFGLTGVMARRRNRTMAVVSA